MLFCTMVSQIRVHHYDTAAAVMGYDFQSKSV